MSEEKTPMIYSAICGVMEDVGAVGKNDINKQQGFKYRGIDAVINALNPAMIKHKIFCVPEVLEQTREDRTTAKGRSLIYSICRIRYRFFAEDGSCVEAVVIGEGMDSGDKATNKAMAAAFKYACFQTFCIPTENLMDDSDADTPDQSSAKGNHNHQQQKPDQSSQQAPQVDAETKKLLVELSSELSRAGYSVAAVTKKYKVECVEQMSKLQLKDCIDKMKNLPDKAAS